MLNFGPALIFPRQSGGSHQPSIPISNTQIKAIAGPLRNPLVSSVVLPHIDQFKRHGPEIESTYRVVGG